VLTILVLGIIITTAAIGLMSLAFQLLRKVPSLDKALNNRDANKRMLQLTLITYASGIIITIYLMATYQPQ